MNDSESAYVLSEMSWVDAGEYFKKHDIALLPVGSTEQHGPQNPLGTDHLIAFALAKEVSKKCSVLCLPPVPFGVSAHHRHFPGTIFIRPAVFREYVLDIILALNFHGIKKVVIVNGHGGNLASLTEVASMCREKKIAFVVIFQWWDAIRGMFPVDEMGHAGSIETSVNLFLHEHLVKMERAKDEEVPKIPRGGFYFPLETRNLTKSGVMGISTKASRDKGEKAFYIAVKTLCRLVRLLKETPFDVLIEQGIRAIKL